MVMNIEFTLHPHPLVWDMETRCVNVVVCKIAWAICETRGEGKVK